MPQFKRVDEQGQPVFNRVDEGGKPVSGPSPTLLESRREAAKMEFEANKPQSTILSRAREAAIGLGEPFALQNLIPSLGKVVKAGVTGNAMEALDIAKGAITAPIEPVKNIIGGIAEGDYDKAAHGAGGFASQTVPAVAGVGAAVKAGASGVKAAVGASSVPESLIVRAAANRVAKSTPIPPTTPVSVRVAKAVWDQTRMPRAWIQERLGKWLASGQKGPPPIQVEAVVLADGTEVPLRPEAMQGGPIEAGRVTPQIRAGAAQDELRRSQQWSNVPEEVPASAPYTPPPSTPPGRPSFVEDALASMQRDLAPDPFEFRTKPPAGPSREIPFEAPDDLFAVPPKPTSTSAPLVNKWMNVPPKEVAHGANPGQRLINEKLIGENKVITKANVEEALKSAGKDLDVHLKAAGKNGVKVNAESVVDEAVAAVEKRIGAPKDATFQNQLSTIVDDIVERYPNLRELTPEAAHALKTDLGDSITWSGIAYDNPLNQLMIRMYRDLNRTIKTSVEGVADLQSRWGDLYVAKRNLADSINRDIVGRGTGPTVTTPKPKR